MVRAHYEALLAKAEYQERAGKLVNADEVKVASHRIAQAFGQHMLQVPASVVAKLQAHVREHGAAPSENAVHSILSAEIRSALEEFVHAMETGAL